MINLTSLTKAQIAAIATAVLVTIGGGLMILKSRQSPSVNLSKTTQIVTTNKKQGFGAKVKHFFHMGKSKQ
jgi:hypothetical protein